MYPRSLFWGNNKKNNTIFHLYSREILQYIARYVCVMFCGLLYSLLPKALAFQNLFKPRCEKTGLPGFRQGPTQTRLYNRTRWLEA